MKFIILLINPFLCWQQKLGFFTPTIDVGTSSYFVGSEGSLQRLYMMMQVGQSYWMNRSKFKKSRNSFYATLEAYSFCVRIRLHSISLFAILHWPLFYQTFDFFKTRFLLSNFFVLFWELYFLQD